MNNRYATTDNDGYAARDIGGLAAVDIGEYGYGEYFAWVSNMVMENILCGFEHGYGE